MKFSFKLPSFLTKKIIIFGAAGLVLIVSLAGGGYMWWAHTHVTTSPNATTKNMLKMEDGLHVSSHDLKQSSSLPVSKNTAMPKILFDEKKDVCIEPSKGGLTLIVINLGMHEKFTDLAIRELPSDVVLSFSPYSKMLNQWFAPAKISGHKIILQIHGEKFLEDVDILSYFDGVIIMPLHEAEERMNVLDNFLFKLKDQEKIILDARILEHNFLKERAKMHGIPVHCISGLIQPDNIVLDEIDFLSQNGIILIDATLVPYMVETFKKSTFFKLQKLEEKKK